MWLFNHKILVRESGLLEGFRDCHCHLLPGVDDGVKDLEDTLLILGDWEIAGVKEVWMTPHIMEDIPNRPEVLLRKFEQVKAAYGGGVKLHLAAEHMLDGLFLKRIDVGEVMAFDTARGADETLSDASLRNADATIRGVATTKRHEGAYETERGSYETARGAYETLSDASLRNADATIRHEGAYETERGSYETLRYDNSLTPDPSPEGEGSENEDSGAVEKQRQKEKEKEDSGAVEKQKQRQIIRR